MSSTRRQGKAEPRWCWSGVAPVAAVRLSASEIDLRILLPDNRSPIEEIVLALGDLGGRYQRYLHQDEFGPSRAERMAALRQLRDLLELLLSRLHRLPVDLRLRLSEQLARDATPVEPDIDNFQAFRSDVAAVQQIGEAALEIERIVHMPPTAHEAALIAELNGAALRIAELLCVLDTTTEGAVAIDSDCPALEIGVEVDIDLIDVTTASARIERLRHRVERVLVGLEQRHGPERHESLRWLVWELCDLYHRETGRRVTNSADDASRCNFSGTRYTGTPQSPAGRFVLAAVKILQPLEALPRAVLFAMREYVARHRDAGRRRGRKPAK
jgi:hypothetical protein